MKKLASILLALIGLAALFCAIVGGATQIVKGEFDFIYSTIAVIILILVGVTCLHFSRKLRK